MVPWSPPPATTNNRPSSNKKILKGKIPTPKPIATSSNMCSNGPESSPVLFNPYADLNNNGTSSFYDKGCTRSTDDDEEERCRSCHSMALLTDWPQGDRVCTSCGVVAEGRLMDDRPEWKDFNEAEDIIKGLPSKSRSGLVAVDETKYVGGLQPTILSKDAFGANSGGYKMTKIRRQLKATNKRLDHIMEKVHKRAFQDAKLERRVRLKRETENQVGGTSTSMRIRDCDSHSEVRPEFDMIVLQEEENANKLHAAIYADKWSLERAIFLNGTSEDTRSLNHLQMGESREDLVSRMDRTLQDASRDLYTAYAMITQAARKLRLPNRVVDEVIHRFIRYTTRRDGFTVKGVSSRLPNRKGKETKEERKIAATRLKEYNKMKQISSLGAAILFLTARALGWARTVVEICDCFQPSLEHSNEKMRIKPKHCSCAMNEIKSYFPEYTRMPIGRDSQSLLNDSNSTSNFADHFIRNLHLPPVSEACIRTLLVHCKHEQMELGVNSGIKMSTLCATITYFVCTVGAAMQKVAHQVHLKKDNASKTKHPSKENSLPIRSLVKGREASFTDTKSKENPQGEEKRKVEFVEVSQNLIKHAEDDHDEDSDSEPFDVFTHAPVVEDLPEKLEYQMRRMWDAWAEQMAWSRTLLEIEQSCSISSNIILNLYKSDMYPRRERLLNALKAAVSTEQGLKSECTNGSHFSLKQTPLASILLAHIPTAGVLMSSK